MTKKLPDVIQSTNKRSLEFRKCLLNSSLLKKFPKTNLPRQVFFSALYRRKKWNFLCTCYKKLIFSRLRRIQTTKGTFLLPSIKLQNRNVASGRSKIYFFLLFFQFQSVPQCPKDRKRKRRRRNAAIHQISTRISLETQSIFFRWSCEAAQT